MNEMNAPFGFGLKRCLPAVLVAGGLVGPATAGSVFVPGGAAAAEGGGSFARPFSTGPSRYQQVIDAGQLAGFAGVIDTIAFRLNGAVPAPSTTPGTFDLTVLLSHTTVTADAISVIYSDNITSPQTEV